MREAALSHNTSSAMLHFEDSVFHIMCGTIRSPDLACIVNEKINFGLTKPYHIIKKMFARLQTLSVLFGTDVPLADNRAHSVFKRSEL